METNLQTFIQTQISTQMASLREQVALATHQTHHSTYQPKTQKIILNPFDGSNPLDWIF